MARILANGKLVVSMHSEDGTPFYGLDTNGVLRGLDVDLAGDIATNLGVAVEFIREARTFDEVVDAVAARKADVAISCISRTRKRAVKVNFSIPYVKLRYAFLVNRIKTSKVSGNMPFPSWVNREDVTIGTIGGSSYVEFMHNDYPLARIVPYASMNEAGNAAAAGEITMAVFDNIEVSKWLNAHPEASVYVRAEVSRINEDPICVVVHWQDTHLLNWINTYLETISNDGSLDRMRKKWMESNDGTAQ